VADQIYLFTGDDTTTVALEMALATHDFQLITPGTSFGVSEHDNLYHGSQWRDGEDLIRSTLQNKVWPMQAMTGDSESATPADDTGDALVRMNKFARQARRYQIDKSYLMKRPGLDVMLHSLFK
jgi:hypothetical protein